MKTRIASVFAAAILASAQTSAQAETVMLNVSGLVSTHSHHSPVEQTFYDTLGERIGAEVVVNYNPLDVLGINMDDTLRMAGDGTFDIVQSTVGNVSRDEPLLEGADLIGVSPSSADLRDAVDAFRDVFAARTEERHNVKTLAIWPYGPQLVFCKDEISGLSDLAGMRVRSYARTLSALLEHVGATPVTLSFAEVYPSLQRGVVDCGITSITSANSGSWPEVATHVLGLSLSHGVQAHFMNLDKWNALPEGTQTALAEAFRDLEDQLWSLSDEMFDDALRCSTGEEPCENYTQFDMTLVEADDEDRALLAAAVREVVLGTWAEACQPTEECVAAWNETVGAARGYEISAAD